MSDTELMCANCGQPLDVGDMYCRACGLPTVHAHTLRARAVETAPDLREMERSFDIAPEPEVMERVEPSSPAKDSTEPLSRLAFAAPAAGRRATLSPLAVVLLVALFGALAVFFLLLSLG